MRLRTVQHFNEFQIPPDSPIAGLPQVAIVGRSNSPNQGVKSKHLTLS